MSKQKEIG